MSAAVHILGIRHHGPGSARSLRRALEQIEPDLLLVEGPADADGLIALAGQAEMVPPVALLVYVPDDPSRCSFYPFAMYSPEWQALRYAAERGVSARFMDLPQAHQLAMVEPSTRATADADSPEHGDDHATVVAGEPVASEVTAPPADEDLLRHDPLGHLARVAGYAGGERWWDHMIESRAGDDQSVFAAVLEAMTALRAEAGPSADLLELRREAFMRKTLREAIKQGHQRIAVVCGAWHAPAMANMPTARHDADLLKGLPKTRAQAAWCPWTYDRLSSDSGYNAGVTGPEWYHMLWEHPGDRAERWLIRVARLLREQDLDCSSASVIEAVRLTEALSALRGRSGISLEDLDEAALSVLCHGDETPMALVRRKLVIGDRLGEVPAESPMLPLQNDLARVQKSVRLKPQAGQRDLKLDLRKELDLQRSVLLHRLSLLNVPWGQRLASGGGTGTFQEQWSLQWQPELVVALIDASRWGPTVADAANGCAVHTAAGAQNLPTLIRLLDDALLADLPDAVAHLMARLQDRLALASDVPQLMDALPPLARVLRYGNVRKVDAATVQDVVAGLTARICIGLPGACASLDDEAATGMFEHLLAVHQTLTLLQDTAQTEAWYATLRQLANQAGLHGLLAGRSVRLLHDSGQWPDGEADRRMSLALSRAVDPAAAAAWLEGFLAGSGTVLVHDQALWSIIDRWVSTLPGEHFEQVLPLLRRTFASFTQPERRQMGERARSDHHATPARAAITAADGDALDERRGDAVLPLLAQILGVSWPSATEN